MIPQDPDTRNVCVERLHTRVGLLLGVLLILNFCAVVSADVPLLPAEFYGNVTLNGHPVPAGSLISATINGSERGSLITSIAGKYGGSGTLDPRLVVNGLDVDYGQPIIFRINGVVADESTVYQPGSSTSLDLSGTEVITGFAGTPRSGTSPLIVTFTDTSDGSPTTWNWTFGDGNVSSLQHPVHTYVRAGIYTVALNASNAGDTNTTTRLNYITVTEPPKPAIISLSPGTATLNSTINFSITGGNYDVRSFRTWLNFTQGAGASAFDNLNITITAVTPGRINGTMVIGPDMPTGSWNLTVSTVDGGQSPVKSTAIVVSRFPAAIIDSVTPVTPWYRNTTVTFAITGKNFRPGQTTLYLVNTSNGRALETLNITGMTTTRIEGSVVVPFDAPPGNAWSANVSTIDSGVNGTRATAFTVAKVPAPTITLLTPATGTKNTTPVFTLTGTNFQTDPSKTRVRIYEDVMDTALALNLTSITPTRITGTVNVTNEAYAGSYNLEVSTVDGGMITRPAAFSVVYSAIPTITTLVPDLGFQNDTVTFTITGTNFQPGNTMVAFRNQTTGAVLNSTMLTSVTGTSITGSIRIPYDAPTGFYRLDITTTDGGVVNKVNAFRVNRVLPPTIATITPSFGAKNSIVAFTITGTSFQTGDKTSLRILDDVSGTQLETATYGVTPTKIIGSVTVPASAPSGKYRLDVRTADGGTVSRYEAFTVNYLSLPVITSITPLTARRGNTVPFVLKGNNFVESGTIVRLRVPGSTINATITSANFTRVEGSFPIPADASTGAYRLDVITLGGGFSSKIGGFVVTA
jgi:PKD repeat protein